MLNKRTQKKIVVVVGKKGKGKNKVRRIWYRYIIADIIVEIEDIIVGRRHNSRDRRHNSGIEDIIIEKNRSRNQVKT